MSLGTIADGALRLVVLLPMLLLAVSAKEAGHALAAQWLGDDTAAKRGRASLWPLSHFDWIGCGLLPALFLLSPLATLYGYGKPVPINPAKLRQPKIDFSLVALAGPAANLLLALSLALLAALLFRGLQVDSPEAALLLAWALSANLLLACVNLLPLPGFAGLKALYVFLPEEWCWRLQSGDRIFIFAVVAAAFFHTLDLALIPGLKMAGALCHWAGLSLPPL